MKNNNSESSWEKPVINKVLLTEVTKVSALAGDDQAADAANRGS